MQSKESAVALSPDSVDIELEKRSNRERRSAWRKSSIFVTILAFLSGVGVTLLIISPKILKLLNDYESSVIGFQIAVQDLRAQQTLERLNQPSLVERVKKDLISEMGLVSPKTLREKSQGVAELFVMHADKSYRFGSAVYLGDGFLITVKHAVVRVKKSEPKIKEIDVVSHGRGVAAEIVDMGASPADKVNVDDWAIIHVHNDLDLVPVAVSFNYPKFAEPVYRIGNDYSNGIIVGSGYMGPIDSEGIASSLADSNPGVSGGGYINSEGELVGLAVGYLVGSKHYARIVPLRPEMFRKVPHLAK